MKKFYQTVTMKIGSDDEWFGYDVRDFAPSNFKVR